MEGSRFDWTRSGTRKARCPACHNEEEIRAAVAVVLPQILGAAGDLEYVSCPACGTVFQNPFFPVDYRQEKAYATSARNFYVEQGAGIESMVRALDFVTHPGHGRYLDIGCGYGFSLDFAQFAFGYEGVGVDPSPIAREGARTLGLTIVRDLASLTDEGEKFDLAFCSEVIEHVADPFQLLRPVFEALSSQGSVILTTPNAGAAGPATAESRLSAILSSPHPVVFSRASLEHVLRKVGFVEVEVWEDQYSLYAVASKFPRQIRHSATIDPIQYRRYLRDRWTRTARSEPLAVGFGGRLYKSLVNAGEYNDAGRVFEELTEALKERFRIDLNDPAGLPIGNDFQEFGRLLPYNITGLLFNRGIELLNSHNNPGAAAALFEAAHRTGKALMEAVEAIAWTDAETSLLAGLAKFHWLLCQARLNPVAALEELNPLPQLPGTQSPHDAILELKLIALTELAMAGRYAEIGRLESKWSKSWTVEAICGSDVGDYVKADALFSLGIFKLNFQADPKAAADLFARSLEIRRGRQATGVDRMAWQSLFHQGLSLKMLGDHASAEEIARQLERAVRGSEHSPLDDALWARIGELRSAGAG